MKLIILALTTVLFLGCAHSIHVVHSNPYDQSPGTAEPELIEARSEQGVVLGFAFDTDYVDRAYNTLQAKCSKGRIEGITTQFSTSLGFFNWTNKILMRGFCYPGSKCGKGNCSSKWTW